MVIGIKSNPPPPQSLLEINPKQENFKNSTINCLMKPVDNLQFEAPCKR